jgi:hypothetical protein
MVVRYAQPQSLDQSGTIKSKHHQNAIEHYSKAIRSIRQSIIGLKSNLRSTLAACFNLFSFKVFHGNIALAVEQVRSGIALVKEWKENYAMHLVPESDAEVIEISLCLEIQVTSFLDK